MVTFLGYDRNYRRGYVFLVQFVHREIARQTSRKQMRRTLRFRGRRRCRCGESRIARPFRPPDRQAVQPVDMSRKG